MIFRLSEEESEWWGDTIRSYRDEIVKAPLDYVERAIEETKTNVDVIRNDINNTLYSVRETGWSYYLEDEARFHREVLSHLMESRDSPREILDNIVEEQMQEYRTMEEVEFRNNLKGLVGEFSGNIMPYLYKLSLSTTQSRRSRAGNTFEKIIEKFLDFLELPYESGASLGNAFFNENNLSKMVDVVVPGGSYFMQNRSQCAILTMKTTLRERWGEVVEELTRTNMPHAYLLTLDEDLTQNVMANLRSYNITIVTYDWIVQDGFNEFDNIIGFEEFFSREIPHHINYWDL